MKYSDNIYEKSDKCFSPYDFASNSYTFSRPTIRKNEITGEACYYLKDFIKKATRIDKEI